MRYFFNLRGDPLRDELGVELPDMDAVRRQAAHSARDILTDHVLQKTRLENFMMVVTDEHGEEVLNLDLSTVQTR